MIKKTIFLIKKSIGIKEEVLNYTIERKSRPFPTKIENYFDLKKMGLSSQTIIFVEKWRWKIFGLKKSYLSSFYLFLMPSKGDFIKIINLGS